MRSFVRTLAVLGLSVSGAFASDRVALGEAKPKAPIVAPIALFAKGTKVGGEPVPVAVGSVHKSPTLGITVAQVKEASALWGLVLLDAPAAPKGDVVTNTAVRSVPLRLGEWIEKPAGLDAVEIVEPANVPIGATVVDDKKRFVGIVARVPGQKNLVIIRERTLRIFASGSIASNVAPAMPPVPIALVVDDLKVSGRLAQRDDELRRGGPRLAAGAAEFAAMPPEVRADAAQALSQGGFTFGDDDAEKTLAVVLPSGGTQLKAALEKVEAATRGIRGLRLVVHVLPADLGTQARAQVAGAWCNLQGSAAAEASERAATFQALRQALTNAPLPCAASDATPFLRAESLLLERLNIDEPLAAAGTTVLALTEPVAVLRAVLEASGATK